MDIILKEYVELIRLLENISTVLKDMIVIELYYIFIIFCLIRSDYSEIYKLLSTPSQFISFLVNEKPKILKDFTSEYEIIKKITDESDMDVKSFTTEFIVWIISIIIQNYYYKKYCLKDCIRKNLNDYLYNIMILLLCRNKLESISKKTNLYNGEINERNIIEDNLANSLKPIVNRINV